MGSKMSHSQNTNQRRGTVANRLSSRFQNALKFTQVYQQVNDQVKRRKSQLDQPDLQLKINEKRMSITKQMNSNNGELKINTSENKFPDRNYDAKVRTIS